MNVDAKLGLEGNSLRVGGRASLWLGPAIHFGAGHLYIYNESFKINNIKLSFYSQMNKYYLIFKGFSIFKLNSGIEMGESNFELKYRKY